MSAMDHLAWLLPLLPLLGGVAWRPIRARWGERVAGWVAWTSCALAAIGWGLACSALVGAHNGALGLGTSLGIRHPLRLTLNLGFEIDIVSALFGLVVAAVSVVIAWPDLLTKQNPTRSRHLPWALAAISLTLTTADYVVLLLGWAAISYTLFRTLDPKDRADRRILVAGYWSDSTLAMGVLGLVSATGTSSVAAIHKALFQTVERDGPVIMCITAAIVLAAILRLGQLTLFSLRSPKHDEAVRSLAAAWGMTGMPGALYVLLRAQPLFLAAPTMQGVLTIVGIAGLIVGVIIVLRQRELVPALGAAWAAACMLWIAYLPLGMLDLSAYHALVLIALAPSLMWVRLTQHAPERDRAPDATLPHQAVQGLTVIALAFAILTLLGAPLTAGATGPAYAMIYGRYEGFDAAWTVGLIGSAILAFWLGLVLLQELPAGLLAAWRYAGASWREHLPWAPHVVWLLLLALGSLVAYSVRRWVAPWSMALGARRMPGLWRPARQQWLVMACVTYLPFGAAALLQYDAIASPLGDALERLVPYLPHHPLLDIASRLGLSRRRPPRRQTLDAAITAMAVVCLVLYALLVAP